MKKAVLFSLILFVTIPNCFASDDFSWTRLWSQSYLTSLLNTPFGMFVGEFDGRTPTSEFNGVFVSNDLGNNWAPLGLNKSGITGLAYSENELYASTYYNINGVNGLYKSTNTGQTWQQHGPTVSLTSVAAYQDVVVIGAYSHGLWISPDSGDTFVQKIGTGFYGPKVNTILTDQNIFLAGLQGKTYKSSDTGATWQEIVAISGKSFSIFTFANGNIFGGTLDNDGLYISKDLGSSWQKLQNFGTMPVNTLSYYNGILYAGKYNSSTNLNSVYFSKDLGISWQDTGLNTPSISQRLVILRWLHSDTGYLYAVVGASGVYNTPIPKYLFPENKFLETPWQTNSSVNFIDYLSAFFDHQYPLLGYSYSNEPTNVSNTTLNFLGIKDKIPKMYYSSHSGIDFALPLGTPILAPAAGTATYYYCTACGNTIKINHHNGYQTIYEHLEAGGLVTTSPPVEVIVGQQIGKVGMTGNTSGPHLHFEVTKDVNNNGNFNDDFPIGRTDPFGWLTNDLTDPWPNYSWTDTLGTHIGTSSSYLWKIYVPSLNFFVGSTAASRILTLENKTFDLNSLISPSFFNFMARTWIKPTLPAYLAYIPNTSAILDVYDTTKQKITTLSGNLGLVWDISEITLNNIDISTLSAYYYDEISNSWEQLASVYDSINHLVTTQTDHLSWFAVLAKYVSQLSSTGWTTKIVVTGASFST